jgi:hypothetical protein
MGREMPPRGQILSSLKEGKDLKTRKLLAILVAVAMIVTMLPVVAFAATSYSATRSVVTGDTSVRVGKTADFTVIFRDANGALVTNKSVTFYLDVNRDTESVVGFSAGTTVKVNNSTPGEGANAVPLDPLSPAEVTGTTSSTGRITLKILSTYPGNAVLDAYQVYDEGEDELKNKIGSLTITFRATGDYEIDLVSDNINPDAGQRFELKATVTRSGDFVEGVEVSFYDVTKTYSVLLGKATTNAVGEAKLKIAMDESGEYEFEARAEGQKSNKTLVTVGAQDPYTLEAAKAERNVAIDESVTVKFVVKDRYGNKIKNESDDIVEAEIITKPSGSDADLDNTESGTNEDGEAEFDFTPDEVGKYVIEARLRELGGVTARTTLYADKFGAVKSIKIDTDSRFSVRAVFDDDGNPLDTLPFDVLLVDANGVEKEEVEDIRVASSNTRIAKAQRDGDSFAVIPQDEDRLGVVTITATHVDTGLKDSVEIAVVGEPVAIDVDVDVQDLVADVTLQFVDVNGNKSYDPDTVEYTVVAGDLVVKDLEDFDDETGEATFTVEAPDYGSYNVTVIAELGISKTFSIDFGAPKAEYGAKKVVLTIGGLAAIVDGEVQTMDVAPFIEEGRTFVPVRFIAEAFGAEADWTPKDAPVETVFLTREDMTITIGIGDSFLTVTKDGEAEVVTFDAAAQIKDGRTFLPFRAIAEAFGAEVDYGPKDAPVQWVSFEQ